MNLIFPTDKLKDEFSKLPLPVRMFAIKLQDYSEFHWVVTSIKSDYTGGDRTATNGPNHVQGIAVDLAPDFHYESISNGTEAPSNYNRLPLLMKAVLEAYLEAGSPNARVVIESDHLHVDTNLTSNLPGVYYYTVNRKREVRRDPSCKFKSTEILPVVPLLKMLRLI